MGRHQKFWIIGLVWLVSAGFTPKAASLYSKAVNFARVGQGDFAFMQFNKLLRNYPKSKYRERALFAIGEYYFQESGLEQAATAFEMLLQEYPESKQRLYVLAYLMSIASTEDNQLLAKDFENQIINLQRVSFVFRNTKEIAFRSPLNQNYKTIIYIDKIEFFLEGELFAKVAY